MSHQWANFADYLLAAGNPTDPAIIDASGAHDYAELRAAVTRLEAELSRLGMVGPNRIAVVGGNSFFWVASYLAAMRVATVVPLSGGTEAELAGQLARVAPAIVLTEAAHRTPLPPNQPVLTRADLTLAGPASPVGAGSAGDAALMFTSGSTAEPQAVRITHQNLFANTAAIQSYLGLQSDDRMLVALPLHYSFGASLLHTHLAVGASVILEPGFGFPGAILASLAEHSATGLAGVPSAFRLLSRAGGYANTVLPSLRRVLQAGGPIDPDAALALAQAQPHSRLHLMYGQTEATARLTQLPPERLAAKPESVGRPLPGIELRVVDAAGAEVPAGEVGEVIVRGASISPGYYADPVATAEKFRDGWLWTGDLGRLDAAGDLFLVGRRADFIKIWGRRISPRQIEQAALAHSAVRGAAAVGLPDPSAGEAVGLAVLGEVSPAELRPFLVERLGRQLLPRAIVQLAEFPLTAAGKLDQVALRRLLEQPDVRSDLRVGEAPTLAEGNPG